MPSPFPELPADVIKMAKDIKPITEIKQSGNDFVVTSKTPGKTVTNSFTIGKEADITTMDGKKLKVCPSSIPGMSAFLFPHRSAENAFQRCFFFHICNEVAHARCHICQTLYQSWYCELSVLCRVPLETAFVLRDKGAFYLLIPSALSIWREASWSAKLASSVTSRNSKEERWLRYTHDTRITFC